MFIHNFYSIYLYQCSLYIHLSYHEYVCCTYETSIRKIIILIMKFVFFNMFVSFDEGIPDFTIFLFKRIVYKRSYTIKSWGIKNGMITITKQFNKIERKQPKSPRKNPNHKTKNKIKFNKFSFCI